MRVASNHPRGVLVLAVCMALVGCEALRAEMIISPAAARDALQSQLGDALPQTMPVDVAALTDVGASYTLRADTERLLVVVFDSREATTQLTGDGARAGGDVVVVRNVVALYDHDRGTVSRLAELRAALRRLDRAAD